jgi:hypothetical protein
MQPPQLKQLYNISANVRAMTTSRGTTALCTVGLQNAIRTDLPPDMQSVNLRAGRISDQPITDQLHTLKCFKFFLSSESTNSVYRLLILSVYFRLQCNLLLAPILPTTCFGRIRPSSGVYCFAKIVVLYGVSKLSYSV